MAEYPDPYTIILFGLIIALAAILVGIIARRRQRVSECPRQRQTEPEARIELRDIRGDKRVDPKLSDVVGVKAARLLEEALAKGLVHVRLESPECPEARIAIDPIDGVVYCIEDEDKGYPLGGNPTQVTQVETKEMKKQEKDEEKGKGDGNEPSS